MNDEPLTFSISGNPRGQGRPRAASRGGFVSVYKAPNDRRYEASVKLVATGAMVGRKPFSGPLSVSLRFRLLPPKSMSKRLRTAILAGEEAYGGKYDLDNMVKAIFDALNKTCWDDDRQIVRLWASKVADPKPGIDVRIEPLSPQDQPPPQGPDDGDEALSTMD